MRVAHPTRAKIEVKEGDALLELDDVKVAYGGIKALKGVSLKVFPGEIVQRTLELSTRAAVSLELLPFVTATMSPVIDRLCKQSPRRRHIEYEINDFDSDVVRRILTYMYSVKLARPDSVEQYAQVIACAGKLGMSRCQPSGGASTSRIGASRSTDSRWPPTIMQ